jgi:DNA primase
VVWGGKLLLPFEAFVAPHAAVIPPDFVQTLLARVDIVDLIGRHVPLKKSGANCTGLCPFHGEKTPSFSVSPAKQMYYCFGCGAHGDVVKFLMEFMGTGFVEAVQDLAQQAGMPVPQDTRSVQERAHAVQAKARQASLSDFLAKAGAHYCAQLQAAPQALAYLEKRGLSSEVMAQFGLGYAPPGWRNLASGLGDYDDASWVDCGLVITQGEPETPEYKRYDRFRDRIMFPIRSVQGEVIGFGGRVLEQAEPKYLNSPETAVFVKGRELYGLHEARAGLRKHGYALVVEGYMDVVALAQSGLDNAVATLGTACSGEHIQKLFRFTESIVFSFDGDAAGRRAAARALQVSLPYASDTRSIKFLFLPTEHDPDSYVRALGKEAFQAGVDAAVPLSRQLIAQARVGCDTLSAEGRAKLLSNARPLWNALPAGVLKMQLLSELAQAAALSHADLSNLWQSAQDGLTGPASTPIAQHQRGLTSKRTPRMFARAAPAGLIDAALRMLLLHSAWWEQLAPEDHELLCAQPEPHGALCTWLERDLHEHGHAAWAVRSQALQNTPWAALVQRLVPPSALDEKMHPFDLRRALDSMWVQQLKIQREQLILQVAQDPSALGQWRDIDAQLKVRLAAVQTKHPQSDE